MTKDCVTAGKDTANDVIGQFLVSVELCRVLFRPKCPILSPPASETSFYTLAYPLGGPTNTTKVWAPFSGSRNDPKLLVTGFIGGRTR